MSRIGARTEILKLADVLHIEPASLSFLEDVPVGALRALRDGVYERLFREEAGLFQRAARVFRRFPARLTVPLAERVFGPLIAARLAGELPGRRAAEVARAVSASFLALAAPEFDPRRARDIIRHVPPDKVLDAARELIRRRDFVTLGRFVDFFPDDTIRQVQAAIEDDRALIHVAFYVESRNRLDHLVRVLPIERLRRVIRSLGDESVELWIETLALVTSVGFSLRRELGDLAAEHGDHVLTGFARAAQEHKLWPDLLDAIGSLSESSLHRVASLPVLRETAILESIVHAADEHDLWSSTLPLVRVLPEDLRDSVAAVAARLPHEAKERIIDATLLGEHWESLLDVGRRMPLESQEEVAEITRRYGEVDPELVERVSRLAEAQGFTARI